MPQPAPSIAPASRPDLGGLLLEAVRQRHSQQCLLLVQQWVHRRGLSSLDRFCSIDLRSELGEEGMHWFLTLLALDPSMSVCAGAAPADAAAPGAAAGVAGIPAPPRADSAADELCQQAPPVQDRPQPTERPAATNTATADPTTNNNNTDTTANTDTAAPLEPPTAAAVCVPPALPSEAIAPPPRDGASRQNEEWQARAQAAVNDAFAALAEAFPEALPDDGRSPASQAVQATPQSGASPAPVPVTGTAADSPTTDASRESQATPAAPPSLPRVLPYRPSPIFTTAPGAALAGEAPPPLRSELICPDPAAIAEDATADPSGAAHGPEAAAAESPSAMPAGAAAETTAVPSDAATETTAVPSGTAVKPAAVPLGAAVKPAAVPLGAAVKPAAVPPGSVQAADLVDGPSTPAEPADAAGTLKVWQQGLGQWRGTLARQGRERFSRLRGLMRECVEETVSLLRTPGQDSAGPAALAPQQQAPSGRPEAVARDPADAGTPPSTTTVAAAGDGPSPPAAAPSWLTLAAVEASGAGDRPAAPAPSTLSHLRAWLPDHSEQRHVS